jgi:hypothetical protein
MRLVTALLLSLSLAALGPACTADGDDDDTTSGVDAGATADAPSGDLPFMSECDPVTDMCDDGLTCFNFNAKGPHCTHDCTVDTDCEAPSPGCNNMGVCKAPD